MPERYIMRKPFVNRVFEIDELSALAEMLRYWYLAHAGAAGNSGRVWCEAIIYAIPRRDIEPVRASLAEKLPAAAFNLAGPDELRVTGPAVAANNPAEISVWREVLAEPQLACACVNLRITFQGPLVEFEAMPPDEGTTTFVLCGAPANGAMLLKAIWRLGHDESMEPVYRRTPSPEEKPLLEAFEIFLGQRNIGPAESAAGLALHQFGRQPHRFTFRSLRFERKVMRILRRRVELPDDRSPKAFLRRVGVPLGTCVGLLGLAYFAGDIGPPLFAGDVGPLLIVLLAAAGYMGIKAARITFIKFRKVSSYRLLHRQVMGKLYSAPAHYEPVDLSQDKTPTLIKLSADLESLGATHVCDLRVSTPQSVLDGNRIYAMGNIALAFGLLRKTEKFVYFPALSRLYFKTRFADGRRHMTTNSALYRKTTRPGVTVRCIPDGGAEETLALHRRHVERLIAEGGAALPAATKVEEVIRQKQEEHEEGRQAWEKNPYSWTDALYQVFKVCRPEYLEPDAACPAAAPRQASTGSAAFPMIPAGTNVDRPDVSS